MTRVLVCGGRDYNHYVHIYDTLDAIQGERGPFEVIIAGRHPGDPGEGADKWAESWSWAPRIPFYGFPARWHDLSHPDAVIRSKPDGTRYDAMAGPRRNGRMLAEGRPTLVIGFPGGRGTRNMLAQAKSAGVERLVIPFPAYAEP